MKTLQDEGKTYRDETVKAVIITTETTNAGTDEDWSQADKIDYSISGVIFPYLIGCNITSAHFEFVGKFLLGKV